MLLLRLRFRLLLILGSFGSCVAFEPSLRPPSSLQVPSRHHHDEDESLAFIVSHSATERSQCWERRSCLFASSSTIHSHEADRFLLEKPELPTKQRVLDRFHANQANALDYADMFGLGPPEAAIYGLLQALVAETPLGLRGTPLLLREDEWQWQPDTGVDDDDDSVYNNSCRGLFTMDHLEQAVEDDFLDAARGSTDNRKGWQVRA